MSRGPGLGQYTQPLLLGFFDAGKGTFYFGKVVPALL
jgi:hypothetical protein